MDKILILIRHGHRDTSVRQMDNGLDKTGRAQAEAVGRFFRERFSSAQFANGLWLVASPKRRCVETLLPLAQDLGSSVETRSDLDEQAARESTESLHSRVHVFLQDWIASSVPVTVLSSHGDWLPLAVYHLIGLRQEPQKGSWTEIEWTGGRACLKWYIPTFKPFYPSENLTEF
ncbi:MAG: histidine phosphatase family protein [Bdellovibrionales bacterium]